MILNAKKLNYKVVQLDESYIFYFFLSSYKIIWKSYDSFENGGVDTAGWQGYHEVNFANKIEAFIFEKITKILKIKIIFPVGLGSKAGT